MPELPELEVIRQVLTRRLLKRPIVHIWISGRGGPLVIRNLIDVRFTEALRGQSLAAVSRRGKYLIFDLRPSGLRLVINPKLTGRLQLTEPSAKRTSHTHFIATFSEPSEQLRYLDTKRMGQIYLCSDPGLIPRFAEQGPEPLEIEQEQFVEGIRPLRGEIKGVLTRGQLVAGIGNAYADEILWAAQIHPFRKSTDLSLDEIAQLYQSMRETLTSSIDRLKGEMGEHIDRKPRGFFAVHLKGDDACPRCGGSISSVKARNRITNFCRTCQPGGLIRGMGPGRS